MSIIPESFITRGNRVNYNYDLIPLIKEFEKDGMYALIYSNDSTTKDNGGYLVITDKQYILTLNYNSGKGTHVLSAAKIYSLIMNKTLDKEHCEEYYNLLKTYMPINARLTYEYIGTNENGRNKYGGRISFTLEDKKFSSKTIDMFLQFYNDYNFQIESICHKYNFSVVFSYCTDYCDEETGRRKYIRNDSSNLDNLKTYILSRQDDKEINYLDKLKKHLQIEKSYTNSQEEIIIHEEIIGTPRKETKKIIK